MIRIALLLLLLTSISPSLACYHHDDPADSLEELESPDGLTRKTIGEKQYLCLGASDSCYPEIFEPTPEFQEVKSGQMLPRGLHIRMNLETGTQEAKLVAENPPRDEVVAVEIAQGDHPEEYEVNQGHGVGLSHGSHGDLAEVKKGRTDVVHVEDQEERVLEKMTPERLQELREIWDVIMQAADSEPSKLREMTKVLRNSSSTEMQILEALEELEPIVRLLEYGKDFVTIGGMPSLVELLGHPTAEVRTRAARVLAASLQSNLAVQEYCHGELQLLPKLLDALSGELDLLAKRRLLLAFSCLVRSHPAATAEVLTQGHLQVLSSLYLNTVDETFRKRCVTLVTDLVNEERERNPEFVIDSQLAGGQWCAYFGELLSTAADLDSVEKGLVAVSATREACGKNLAVLAGLARARELLNGVTDKSEYETFLEGLLLILEVPE